MTLLIADHNQRMREAIKRTIRGGVPDDHTIYEASDGGEAVDLYERVRPDWVLMDIKMEPIDGLVRYPSGIKRRYSPQRCQHRLGIPGWRISELFPRLRSGWKTLSICGAPIERIVVGQRGTHFCPNCQPLT